MRLHVPTEQDASLRSPAASAERAGVALSDDNYRVVALFPIGAGEVILRVYGIIVDQPSKYSVQVDRGVHVDLPSNMDRHADPHHYRWRYLNHSCEPNAALDGLDLVALRPIERWEEITFDYNTTEESIAVPFRCSCGCCGGRTIRGFRHLDANEQRALLPRAAEHLRRLTMVRQGA